MARKQPTTKAAQPASQTGLVNKPETNVKKAAAVKGAVTLDRSKKFYDVHSGGNVKYEQDGKLFNLEGNQVDLDGNPVKGKVVEQEPDPVVEAGSEAQENLGDANGGDPDADKPAGVASEDELAALGGN